MRYVYTCELCGNDFEVEKRWDDTDIEFCPQCLSPKVHKRIQPTVVIFKGSGFTKAARHKSENDNDS